MQDFVATLLANVPFGFVVRAGVMQTGFSPVQAVAMSAFVFEVASFRNGFHPGARSGGVLQKNEPAPDFELPNQDGDTVALSDYEDQYVVVYFYPRADTPGCTTQACSFRDRWDDYVQRDVTVLGISDDPVEDLADFQEKYDLPFDLLSDEDGNVSSEYDSYGEKNMFGNTFDGVFRNTFVVGPDGDTEAVFEGVDPEEHADEVLAVID